MKIFNKASKFLTNYFKHDESLDKSTINIEDCLIYLNSQIVIWKDETSYDDDQFTSLLSFRFNKQFIIYNLQARKLNLKKDLDKVVDFSVPDLPSYTLEFLLTFAISAKNWLSLDSYNVLVVHDELKNPRVLSLLSTVLSYLNKSSIQPMDIYANIISTNKAFEQLSGLISYRNVTRYINYFSMLQKDPIFEYKKLFLQSLIINGAPAIDNLENSKGHYITINDKSFYKPILRILSNNKVIYCSFKKNVETETVYYSVNNCKKFDISAMLFGETVVEVLHYSVKENKFKQLFVIQFHTFYVTETGLRFTRDQIDGVCKDIRYPEEFFVDLIFDDSKAANVSIYEDEVAKWKNVISDFILKGYKINSNSNMNSIVEEESVKDSQKLEEKILENKSDVTSKIELHGHEEDLSSKPNTLNKAEEILQKFGSKHQEDEDEEDIEDYLKGLENKTN